MTKKQIILALLPIYKKAIEHIDGLGDMETARSVLVALKVGMGICAASKNILKEYIGEEKWVNRHCTWDYKNIGSTMRFWAKTPFEATSTDEMVELLQIRVDIMEKELKRKWWHIFK